MTIAPPRYTLRDRVPVPMRDGTHLAMTLYLPKDAAGPLPTVLAVTPYGVDRYHAAAAGFAARGFASAIVDVRGQGHSEGRFTPFAQESVDAHDLLDWLAAQQFCNGRIGMWGGSYMGHAQWAASRGAPAPLHTIIPVAAAFVGIDFPMRNNIFQPFALQWLTCTSGAALQANRMGDRSYWSDLFHAWHMSGRRFRDLDTVIGRDAPIFQKWLDHPHLDDYWDSLNPSDQDYGALNIPVLTITGIYDDDQPGALEHYRRHLRHGGERAGERHYLVIGPWDHAGTRYSSPTVGGLPIAPTGQIDTQELEAEWLGWALSGEKFPAFLEDRVAYYVMGRDEWRYASSLDAVTDRHAPLHLDSNGTADDVLAGGWLGEEPGRGVPDRFRFDMRDTTGPEIAAEARRDPGALIDEGIHPALCGKALFYHSAPFVEDVDLCGFFRLKAWLAIDCPDADFYVSVHEVDLQGRAILLTTDAIRARYRSSLREPSLVAGPEPLPYMFDRFTFTARTIARGHRLRLVIAPMGRLMEGTFTERNFGGGGVVAEESIADAQRLTVTLHHDAEHASVLHLPIGCSQI